MEEYKIYISDKAQNDLKFIHDYCLNISLDYSLKVKNQLLVSILILKIFPRRCPKIKLKNQFYYESRYLISGNYKILFLIKDDFIIILRIYNFKQNSKIYL